MAISDSLVEKLIEKIDKLANKIDSGQTSTDSNRKKKNNKSYSSPVKQEDAEKFLNPDELDLRIERENTLREAIRLKTEEIAKGSLADANVISQQNSIIKNINFQKESQDKLVKTIKNSNDAFDSLTNSFGQLSSGIKDMKINSITDGIKGIYTEVSNLSDAFDSGSIEGIQELLASIAKNLEEISKDMFDQFIQSTMDLALKFEDLERNIRKATGASAKFAKDIRGLRNDVIMAGVSAEELAEAHTTLANTFTDYTMMGSQSRQEMLKVTSILGELGASSADTAQSFQNLTKGLGMTTSAAGQTLIEIEALGKDIGVSASKMASDFNKVTDNVLKLGSKGPQAFKDLAVAAKITGLEIEKITQMTNKFDTFDGAAEQVGKLNAALGGNFVNAMDLMMTTDPTERFNMIRDSILDAGLSFEEMSYHQQQFYADSLGLSSVSDLSKALSGDMDALNGSLGDNSAEMEAAEKRAQSLQTFQESLQNLFASFVPVFTPMIDGLQGMASWIGRNAKTIKKLIGVILTLAGYLGYVISFFIPFVGVLVRTAALFSLITGNLMLFGDAGGIATKAGDYISESISNIGEAIGRVTEKFSFLSNFGNSLNSFLDDTIEFLGYMLGIVLNLTAASIDFGNFLSNLESMVEGTFFIFESFHIIYKLLTDSNYTLKDAMLDLAKSMLKEFSPIVFMFETLGNIVVKVIDLVAGIKLPNFMIGDKFLNFVSSIGSNKSTNSLTPMATGGIVEGPTPALVGEAGPEAIIPLDKLQTFISPIVNNPVTQMIQQATSGMFQGGPKEITVYLTLDGKVIDKKVVDVMNQKAVDSLRGF